MVEALDKLQSIEQIAGTTTSRSSKVLDVEKPGDEEQQREKGDLNKEDIGHVAPTGERESSLEEPLASQKTTEVLEPSLSTPKLGDPISHGQIIDLWRKTKAQNVCPTTLDALMRGSRIYVASPAAKQEPACVSLLI